MMLRNWWLMWMIQSRFKTLCLVCYFFFAYFYVCAEKRKFSYRTPVNFVAGGAGTSMLIQPARSKIECAVRCSENQVCATFHFDKSNGNCLTKNSVIDGNTGDIYDCLVVNPHMIGTQVQLCLGQARCLKVPDIAGYVLYTQADGQIYWYLKIIDDPEVEKPTAASKCEADGGHLLLIEDKPASDFIRDILRAGPNADYWIDGEDPDGGRNYITRNKEPLPYKEWGPNDPNTSGRACIRLITDRDYLFGDEKCTIKAGYICQVDI